MWSPADNQGFKDERDYLVSLKRDDKYSFHYVFEYIAKNHGNDVYDIGEAEMRVEAIWSESQLGYALSYDVPESYHIDPRQGNGDAAEFFEQDVRFRVMTDLASLGVSAEAVVV